MAKLNEGALPLLSSMFPGSKCVPGFSDLDESIELAASIRNIDEAASAYVLIRAQNSDLDINAIIKLMKLGKTFDVTDFLNSALEVYFSSTIVVSQLTNAPVPLFPNERVLSDIDYDLLEPVYIRITLG